MRTKQKTDTLTLSTLMRTTTVPVSDLLAFLVDHGWCMDGLSKTLLRPFTERQLRGAWARVRASAPTNAITTDDVRIALLIARGM